jgi:hypothetical protein
MYLETFIVGLEESNDDVDCPIYSMSSHSRDKADMTGAWALYRLAPRFLRPAQPQASINHPNHGSAPQTTNFTVASRINEAKLPSSSRRISGWMGDCSISRYYLYVLGNLASK